MFAVYLNPRNLEKVNEVGSVFLWVEEVDVCILHEVSCFRLCL